MKRYFKNKTIASITKSIGRNIKSQRRSKDKKLQWKINKWSNDLPEFIDTEQQKTQPQTVAPNAVLFPLCPDSYPKWYLNIME